MKPLIAKIKHINSTRALAYTLFALSALIALATAYYVISIDVLKDWRLELPKQEIHAGDTIVVSSVYDKQIPVEGDSTRYIECDSGNGFIRYEINKKRANRGQGKGGTGLELLIPAQIPNLPKTCKISVVIVYHVLPLRDVIESNETGTFQLLPAKERSSNVNQETTQSNQAQVQASGVTSLGSSSLNNTPNNSQPVSNTSQETENTQAAEQTEPAQQPTLLDRILKPVTNLSGGN